MMRRDESGPPLGGGGEVSREALEQRVRELEREVGRLQAELAEARAQAQEQRDELYFYHWLGMPMTEEEFREGMKNGPSLSDLIAECGREFGK